MSSFPKISWAQNRRSINLSILVKNLPETVQHPSILLSNENKTVSIQCQGCLLNENPSENLRSFDISLNLSASVLPIASSQQIKITDRYIRIILFKRARKSWEKLIDTSASSDATGSSAEHYRKNMRTAIVYDWDLCTVLERELEEALIDAGMADDDFSTSEEDEFEDDDDDNDGKKSKTKNAKKKNRTSRSSKDPVYGDASSTETDSEEEEERLITGSNKEPANNSSNKKQQQPPQEEKPQPTKAEKPQKENPDNNKKQQEQQQQKAKEEQQKKIVLAANRQFQEMNKHLPVGERRSMTDRRTLILVIVVGTLCGLIGALVSGTVVYWNMSSAAVSPDILQQFARQHKENVLKPQNVIPVDKSEDL